MIYNNITMFELYCSNLYTVCTILKYNTMEIILLSLVNLMLILCECHFGMMTLGSKS